MIEIRQRRMISPGTGFLIRVGVRAASFAANMPNTLCAWSHRRKRSRINERKDDFATNEGRRTHFDLDRVVS
jgi:hypothetical protein